jgi:uncharacterized protein
MATEKATDDVVTVIIGQRVRAGSETEFLAWQNKLNETASHYPGFIAAEVNRPTSMQADWVVVYRFDSIANVQAWMNSATRQDALVAGRRYLDGPPTQQIVGGEAKPADHLVTVVITHRVAEADVDEFLAWQQRFRLAESEFQGFRGYELFRPIEGVQDEWTAMYRFDSAADLEAWLTSDERKQLLEEGKKFQDYQLRTVDNSFGNWFAFDEQHKEAAPSDIKTSIAVWVGLYPTVVLLTLAQFPLHLPLWLGMLIGNLLSSIMMTFVTMPFYVNPLLKRWLQPPGQVSARTNMRSAVFIAVVMALWAVFFWWLTNKIWSPH